jgi:hypothetical protein
MLIADLLTAAIPLGAAGIFMSMAARPDIARIGKYLWRTAWITLLLVALSPIFTETPNEQLLLVGLWLLPRLLEALVTAVAGYWLWVVGRGLLRWARKQ